MSCSSSRASSPRARPGTPRASSASSARRLRSPRCCNYSVDLYKRLDAETGPRHRLEDDRLPQARHQRGPLDRVPAPRDHGAELRHGHAPAVAGRGQGDVAADGRRRSRRRELPADRRAGQSLRHRPVARQGRAHARREASSKASRVTGFEMEGGRIIAVRHERGAHRLREGGQLRRPVGAADRRDGRRQRAAAAGQASVYRSPRRSTGFAPDAGDDPRSRPAHLLQGRGRRPGVRRLRAEPDRLDDRRRSRRLRVPAVRRRLGPFRAAHDAGARPRAGARKRRRSSR